MSTKKLKLEVNNKGFTEKQLGVITNNIMMTPAIGDSDYWLFRVKISATQAIIAFPKFGTIGIGFERESDWNTNLPYNCNTNEIFNHIKHNKGCRVADSKCIDAIKLIQSACKGV